MYLHYTRRSVLHMQSQVRARVMMNRGEMTIVMIVGQMVTMMYRIVSVQIENRDANTGRNLVAPIKKTPNILLLLSSL